MQAREAESEPACSCCRAKGLLGSRGGGAALLKRGGRALLAGKNRVISTESRGGTAADLVVAPSKAAAPSVEAGSEEARAQERLRSEFAERFAERIGSELFGLSPQQARSSYELCERALSLGLRWDDEARAARLSAGGGLESAERTGDDSTVAGKSLIFCQHVLYLPRRAQLPTWFSACRVRIACCAYPSIPHAFNLS